MVVVLGDEETEVDNGHGLAKAWVERGAGELGIAHSGELFDDAGTDNFEVGQNIRDRAVVMAGFVGFAIFKVGGMQLGSADIVIIETLFPERLEIEEVASVFLDRPFAVMASSKDFGRQFADGIGQAFRSSPKSFQKLRSCVRPKAEFKLAVEPASCRRHSPSQPICAIAFCISSGLTSRTWVPIDH